MGKLEKQVRRRPWRDRQGSDGSLAPFGAVYLALLGLGTVGALAVYLLLIAFVPGASGTRLDAMKTALLVVAGSGAGAGLYVQYRKQQTDEVKSALDHANSRRDQDKLFTERYTQAAAQLGNGAAAVRLAGVYALARIADDSGRDRPTCLKVLCAYLRMPYDPGDRAKADEREVRATAQTVLVERLHADHPGFWAEAEIDLRLAHLLDFDLSGATVAVLRADRATFSGDAGFVGATFTRNAAFSGATFTRNAAFREATFTGDAGFDHATFSGDAQFGEVTFTGNARFDTATFSSSASFFRATFTEDAWFDQATFTGDTGFEHATFFGNARFDQTTFAGYARFDHATFCGYARFDRATFSRGAWLGRVTFIGDATFDKTTFTGDVRFDETTFNRGALFDQAVFSSAGFDQARFSGDARFVGARFSGDTWFVRATFTGDARFGGAAFTGRVKFGDAKFGEAIFSGEADFGEARFRRDQPPEWPEEFAEPTGIVWDPSDPPAPVPGSGPNPPSDPADPPNSV